MPFGIKIISLLAREKYDYAEKKCLEKLKLNKENIYILIILAMVYKVKKEFKKSINIYEKIFELSANCYKQIKLRKNVVELNLRLGKIDNAIETQENILALESDKENNYYDLLNLYLKKKDLKNSMRIVKLAMERFPTSAEAHHRLGYVYYFKKDLKKSIAEMKKAIEMQPKQPTRYYHYGLILEKSNKLNEALEQFKIAHRMAPKKSENAVKHIASLKAKLNNP